MFQQFFNWLNAKPQLPDTGSTNNLTVGLLLAAGRGARFDQSGEQNKLLSNLQGKPVIWHSAKNLAASVDKAVAVVRPESELRPLLEELGYTVVECRDAISGMGHSLAWGVAEAIRLWDMQRLVIGLGDMPFVQTQTIRTLISNLSEEHKIIAPVYKEKRGNPVAFHHEHFYALSRMSGDTGAAKLFAKFPVHLVEVDDSGIHQDIDIVEDLARYAAKVA